MGRGCHSKILSQPPGELCEGCVPVDSCAGGCGAPSVVTSRRPSRHGRPSWASDEELLSCCIVTSKELTDGTGSWNPVHHSRHISGRAGGARNLDLLLQMLQLRLQRLQGMLLVMLPSQQRMVCGDVQVTRLAPTAPDLNSSRCSVAAHVGCAAAGGRKFRWQLHVQRHVAVRAHALLVEDMDSAVEDGCQVLLGLVIAAHVIPHVIITIVVIQVILVIFIEHVLHHLLLVPNGVATDPTTSVSSHKHCSVSLRLFILISHVLFLIFFLFFLFFFFHVFVLFLALLVLLALCKVPSGHKGWFRRVFVFLSL
mmetsp:Transcript_48607/g.87333  ORF Transcript_48607/g.87333 Transcript_48607/m.87333 type:complete len:311 (-) Transcript_48607:236-1168(-)